MLSEDLKRFRIAYAEHRRREGHAEPALEDFPYIRRGPLRKTWSVRARSYETVLVSVIQPLESRLRRAMTIVDLGAGNGWLSLKMSQRGHAAIAIDLRSDDVDGLGVTASPASTNVRFHRIVADFCHLPVTPDHADVCLFNASFHYATSAAEALEEAVRITRKHGRILIVDTPFYETSGDGQEMVAAKKKNANAFFGDLAADLTAIPFIEYLTPGQLESASRHVGLTWTRHRVRYPLWYEVRPWIARIRKQRVPSRFDVWEGRLSA